MRETIAPVGGVLDGVQPRLRYLVVDAGAMGVEDGVPASRVWALVGLESSATVTELLDRAERASGPPPPRASEERHPIHRLARRETAPGRLTKQ